MMISIQLLKKEHVDEALSFLQPYESECVNLASEILRGSAACWAIYYAEQAQAGNVSRDQDAGGQKIAAQDALSSPGMTAAAMSFPGSIASARKSAVESFPIAKWSEATYAGIFQGQKLAGLIALRKKRSLFFCLPFAKYKSAFDKKVCSEAQRPLMEFFESREPFCVNGEAAGAIFLRNILKNKKSPMHPSVTNKYFLMARDSGTKNESKPAMLECRINRNIRAHDQVRANSGIESHAQDAGGGSGAAGGLRVIQATAADFDSLLPLELGYQREEVVPASFDISDAALAAAFKHELGQGLTFALYDGERPIAKARVSARGLRHCMLGGVYTIPSERKKGRAAFLVRQIISFFESGLDGQRQNAGGQNCSQGLKAGGGSIDSSAPRAPGIASDSGKPDDSRPSLAFNGFCLYAKQENAAALALYKSLGFVPRGEYLLVYY